MKTISLHQAKKVAAARAVGYIDDIMRLGTVNGDLVTLSDSDFDFLIEKYRNNNSNEVASKPVAVEIVDSINYNSLDSNNMGWESEDESLNSDLDTKY